MPVVRTKYGAVMAKSELQFTDCVIASRLLHSKAAEMRREASKIKKLSVRGLALADADSYERVGSYLDEVIESKYHAT